MIALGKMSLPYPQCHVGLGVSARDVSSMVQSEPPGPVDGDGDGVEQDPQKRRAFVDGRV